MLEKHYRHNTTKQFNAEKSKATPKVICGICFFAFSFGDNDNATVNKTIINASVIIIS
jgi:hypothetical protein